MGGFCLVPELEKFRNGSTGQHQTERSERTQCFGLGIGIGTGTCSAYDARRAYDHRKFLLKQAIVKYLASQGIHSQPAPSPYSLIFDQAFTASLRTIPPSPYRVHKSPRSLMAELEQGRVTSINLPMPDKLNNLEGESKMPSNGVQNKLFEHVVRTPGRQPSPQPTHLGVPGSSQHRILHEEGSGYVAPKFEGKELQMDEGNSHPLSYSCSL